jgi:general secretion pathway protein B
LYRVEVKSNHNPWLIPALLLMSVLILLAIIWLLWPRINSPVSSDQKIKQDIVVPPTPQLNTSERTVSKHEKHISESRQRKITTDVTGNSQAPLHSKIEPLQGSKQSSIASANKPSNIDPLSDLPPMNISGYLHNEQNGNLVMINNQVVHEGDEISPGLRVIKILDDSAIFSYKGYVFSR